MKIEISQSSPYVSIAVDGVLLPNIFSGYELKSSKTGEMELALIVKGDVTVSAMQMDMLPEKTSFQEMKEAMKEALKEPIKVSLEVDEKVLYQPLTETIQEYFEKKYNNAFI